MQLSGSETQIPEKILSLLERMETLFDTNFYYEANYTLFNRGGYPYAKGEAIVYRVCTSSFANGPDIDYSEEIKQILRNTGFECHGDGNNGLDPAGSFGRDTYWTYHFLYRPSVEEIYD